jgi:hypothetical protein
MQISVLSRGGRFGPVWTGKSGISNREEREEDGNEPPHTYYRLSIYRLCINTRGHSLDPPVGSEIS